MSRDPPLPTRFVPVVPAPGAELALPPHKAKEVPTPPALNQEIKRHPGPQESAEAALEAAEVRHRVVFPFGFLP